MQALPIRVRVRTKHLDSCLLHFVACWILVHQMTMADKLIAGFLGRYMSMGDVQIANALFG